MNFYFDGLSKTITPDTGLTQLDSKDLYSEWKQWVGIGDNSKWPQAFDVLGGDELSPGINAGAYFFLRNDLGWRIKPAEITATVYIYGNLVPRDSALPIIIPTTGNYCVMYLGLQPITQSVETILTQQQLAAYNGTVNVDTYHGSSGNAYPYGTPAYPVKTLNDGIAIAELYQFDRIALNGDFVFNSGQDYSHYAFVASTAMPTVVLQDNLLKGSSFYGCTVTGVVKTDPLKTDFLDCLIVGLSNVNGYFKNCGFEGHIDFVSGTQYLFQCASASSATFCSNGNTGVNYIIRGWSGPISFSHCSDQQSAIMMDCNSSHVTFLPNYESGYATLYGVGQITNLSTGNLVINAQLLEAPQMDRIEQKVDNVMAVSL